MSPYRIFFVLQISHCIIAGSARGSSPDSPGCGPFPSVNDGVESGGVGVPRLFQVLVQAAGNIQLTDRDNRSDIDYGVAQHDCWILRQEHPGRISKKNHRSNSSLGAAAGAALCRLTGSISNSRLVQTLPFVKVTTSTFYCCRIRPCLCRSPESVFPSCHFADNDRG